VLVVADKFVPGIGRECGLSGARETGADRNITWAMPSLQDECNSNMPAFGIKYCKTEKTPFFISPT
jgi:hypothetical protein